jgi:hypothetical protein
MKSYYRLLLVIFTCTPFILKAQQEKVEFDVIQNDKIIGTAIATKTIDGAEITYSNDTNIKIQMLARIKVTYGYD